MNKTLKEIYDDYRYELLKTRIRLEESPEQFSSAQSFEEVSNQIDKLELLIDLYAYLLANHTH